MIRRDLCDNAEKTNKPILTFATFLSKKDTGILQSNIIVDLDKIDNGSPKRMSWN